MGGKHTDIKIRMSSNLSVKWSQHFMSSCSSKITVSVHFYRGSIYLEGRSKGSVLLVLCTRRLPFTYSMTHSQLLMPVLDSTSLTMFLDPAAC